MKKIIPFLCVAFFFSVLCSEKEDNSTVATPITPPTIGLLSLSSSQMPGPLFLFGHTVVDKGDKLLFAYANYTRAADSHLSEVAPYFIYGINDNCALYVTTPVITKYCVDGVCTSGLTDASMHLEYAFYNKSNEHHWDSATVIAQVFLPTGTDVTEPTTGFGSTSFFTGITLGRWTTEWFFMNNYGIFIPTKHNGIEYGTEFLYQAGVGRLIWSTKSWIFSWLVELTGSWSENNFITGIVDSNSGGNLIFIAPSLWFSTKHATIQAGIALPVVQHLNGVQPEQDYVASVGIGWKF